MLKRLCAALTALILTMSLALAVVPVAHAEQSTIVSGLTQSEVKRIQERLIYLGFLTAEADGMYGKQTKSAVESFQAFASGIGYQLDADGIAGERTCDVLFDDAVAERRFSVRRGDSGAPVKRIQNRLLALGYLTSAPDGAFGENGERALTAFQQMLVDENVDGIVADGVANKLTRQYLFDEDLSAFDIKTPVFFDDSDPLALEDCYLFAEACVLIDAATGEVLYGKNESARMYPASTTKLMTLLLGVARDKLKGTVTVPEAAAQIPGDSSRVPVYPGEQMPYADLLYGLMMNSGNDAANAIAVLEAGSVDAFVGSMNKRAQALGMTNTHFVNPHGYHDPEHYTTAADMAKLMVAAMGSEKARTVLKARTYTMAATAKRGKELKLSSSYELYKSSSKFYDPNVLGGKTGYTGRAGQCFVGAAEKDGVKLVAVVLKSGYNKTDKWLDANRLFNYGYALRGQ